MSRVRQGDPEALNEFFDAFFPRVYGYLATTLRDTHLAEDLTQESFIRIHRHIGKLDPSRDPAPWVFTVVTNTLRDFWRSRQHKMASKHVDLDAVSDLDRANGSPSAENGMIREESAEAIRKALGNLAPNDREVILLRNYEGLDTSKIAEILDLSPEAVRQRHSRAVGRLGKEYRRIAGPTGEERE